MTTESTGGGLPIRLRRQELEWVSVEGEVVVLDAGRSVYLNVNPSGAVMWQALIEGATRAQLVEALRGGFAIDQAQAERDVENFLGQLADLGLLEESGGN